MKRQNVRTLALIVGTITYLLLGTAIFDTLETAEEEYLTDYSEQLQAKWNNSYHFTDEDWRNMTAEIPRLKAFFTGTGPQWRFAGAFYFCTTVITTIGYGHSTPKTTSGKIFCMAYALMGIPMCIVTFQSIGERMNSFLTFLLGRVKRFLGMKQTTVSDANITCVSLSLVFLVLLTGTFTFSSYEQWPYMDSFYYCFITLTTIGFGDFVALQRKDYISQAPDYVTFSLIFILSGLTVVSSAMNLLVLRFLTMNTEDERRDECEAAFAASTAHEVALPHHCQMDLETFVGSPGSPLRRPWASSGQIGKYCIRPPNISAGSAYVYQPVYSNSLQLPGDINMASLMSDKAFITAGGRGSNKLQKKKHRHTCCECCGCCWQGSWLGRRRRGCVYRGGVQVDTVRSCFGGSPSAPRYTRTRGPTKIIRHLAQPIVTATVIRKYEPGRQRSNQSPQSPQENNSVMRPGIIRPPPHIDQSNPTTYTPTNPPMNNVRTGSRASRQPLTPEQTQNDVVMWKPPFRERRAST